MTPKYSKRSINNLLKQGWSEKDVTLFIFFKGRLPEHGEKPLEFNNTPSA